LAKPASTLSSLVTFTEHAADLGSHSLALFLLQIEDGNLHALCSKRARGGSAEAGSTAGDHGSNGIVELHCELSSLKG
jgi:hypothetical protein